MAQNRKAGVKFIFITLLLDVLGIGIIIPVLPQLVTEMTGGSASEAASYYGVLAAVYSLMQFLCAPLIGALSDRYGRRRVILLALFAFGVDYLVMGFAPTLWWLFAARVVSGFTGATITAANAYIADISTKETRAQNFGLVGAAFGLGFILGPALGGLLGEVWLRLPFFAAAFVTLLNAAYGFFVLPESLPEENRRPFSWARANPIGGLYALKAYPAVLGLAFAFLFFSLAQRGLETVWVLYTNYRYGWGELENGLALTVVGLAAAVVQGGLIRRIMPVLGERRAVVFGFLIAIVSFCFYGAATQGWMVIATILFGALGGIAGPAIQGMVAGAVPGNEQGSVQGALTSLMSLTAVFAPLISTQLFAHFSGEDAIAELPGVSFFAGAGFMALALLVVLATLRRHPDLGTDGDAPGASPAPVPPGDGAEAPADA